MTIQEIVARVWAAILALRDEGKKPSWVVLHAERYRDLQAWHRWLGDLPAGDYIDEDHLFDIPISLDNTVEFAVLGPDNRPVILVPWKKEDGENR